MKLLPSLVITAAAVVSLALLALNIANHAYYADSISGILYHFVVPAALAAGLLAALRLSRQWRGALALCLVAVVPALYATEAYLTLRTQTPKSAAVGAFDTRSKLQVILDFKNQGIEAYPAMRAKSMLVDGPDGGMISALGGDGVLPLANLPNKRVVGCNETGRWMVFDSDEYGFHNPAGTWRAQPLPVALVGDSFTEGNCLASDKNIAAHLRKRFGAVLNLGVSGFGPLSELAAVKEYLIAVKPKVVAWLYFEGNDLFKDLPEERRSKVLTSYLNDGFSQRLMGRRDEIAARFKAYLDAKLVEAMNRVDHPYEDALDFLQLYYLRGTFGLDPVGLGVVDPVDADDYRIFADVLKEARRTVEAWGGRLVFVFMPDSPRYFAAARDSRIRDRVRQRILAIVAGLGIPLIDVHPAFAAERDPRALFTFHGSHYNEAGYRLAAEAIGRGIEALAAGR
ncbi:MAG: SGNH/GDSL hydrolase family protein [Rhodospirillales bacterium]|nr:SGNH/GDSL hydrolase family protein [Rhodospirillales bacterium]